MVVADMIGLAPSLPSEIRAPRSDALLPYLICRGSGAIVRYPTPIHLQPAFADPGPDAGRFPVAEAAVAFRTS